VKLGSTQPILRPAPEFATSPEKRAALTAEIEADLLAVQREEEALIIMSEATDSPILRRPDAEPRAVLGLAA
jgi:hypothetical protein